MLQLMYNIDLPEAACYRDDLNSLQFYVVPKVPILRRDEQKKAVFKYVKYRTLKPMANGDVGAALVFMDVELALSPQQEQSVRQKLAEIVKQGSGANAEPINPASIILSKPQISKATVKVEVLADSGNLVQKVNHAGSPSMYGNNVVAMSAELNQLGAPIFEAVMKSQGAGGIRVVYDIEFAARLPAIKADGTGAPRSSTASARRRLRRELLVRRQLRGEHQRAVRQLGIDGRHRRSRRTGRTPIRKWPRCWTSCARPSRSSSTKPSSATCWKRSRRRAATSRRSATRISRTSSAR